MYYLCTSNGCVVHLLYKRRSVCASLSPNVMFRPGCVVVLKLSCVAVCNRYVSRSRFAKQADARLKCWPCSLYLMASVFDESTLLCIVGSVHNRRTVLLGCM